MNIQAPIKLKHTAAEEALFQLFETAREPSGTHTGARETAIAQLRDNGLPTRRVEAWHYTDLRKLINHVAEPLSLASGQPLLADACPLAVGMELDGVLVSKWSEDQAALGTVARDDAIGQINTALAAGGVIANIADSAQIAPALAIEKRSFHSRNHIKVGVGAKATITQVICAEDGLSTDVTRLDVASQAHVTFVIVCENHADASDLSQFRVSLADNATLNILVMNMGGKIIRREIVVAVQGEGANLDIKGVNLVGGDSHIDVTTVLAHDVAHTNSTQLFRNILTESGKGVFQGQIKVRQIAQKTDAQMACNTLLLSDDAAFYAKPELEIFADDVVCAHGATVTELDKNHLFYLMARGITERSARGLLVEAFVAQVVEGLEDEALVAALETRIAKWLEVHG